MAIDENSSGWDRKYAEQAEGPAWNSDPQPGVSTFLQRLPQGALILDVGSGDGRNSMAAVEANHQVVMLDVASKALELALALVPAHKSRPVAIEGSMEEMPLASSQFDGVLCLDALPQVTNAHRALREMHRVLRHGGYAFVNVFTLADCAWGEGEQIGPRSWAYKNTLFSFYGPGELEVMCRGLFEIVAVERQQWRDPPHVPFRPYEHTHDALFYTLSKP